MVLTSRRGSTSISGPLVKTNTKTRAPLGQTSATMIPQLAALLLLPIGALATPLLTSLTSRAVSPDNTCGAANSGYTCPSAAPCCSQYGYCGSTDAFCLTTATCQTRYSNSSSACYAPKPGVSISVDGTCGTTGVGKNGYRCPGNATVVSCCSVAYVLTLLPPGEKLVC